MEKSENGYLCRIQDFSPEILYAAQIKAAKYTFRRFPLKKSQLFEIVYLLSIVVFVLPAASITSSTISFIPTPWSWIGEAGLILIGLWGASYCKPRSYQVGFFSSWGLVFSPFPYLLRYFHWEVVANTSLGLSIFVILTAPVIWQMYNRNQTAVKAVIDIYEQIRYVITGRLK
jgi:hypothetical protein